MAKKVILGPKPQQNPGAPGVNADEWVNGGLHQGELLPSAIISATTATTTGANVGEMASDAPAMKRLTIDVPETLHAQIKSRCALKGVKMADEIRALLEGHFLTQEGA